MTPDELYTAKVAKYIRTGDLGPTRDSAGNITLAGFTDHELNTLYVSECKRFGLDPVTRPFDVIEFQKKTTLYITSRGVDQLAFIHCVTRVTVKPPTVVTMAGIQFISCQVDAILPNGRRESSTATLPCVGKLDVNHLMKCETKAKRRATLSILSVGVFAEDEIDSLPGMVAPKQLDTGTLAIHVARCLESTVVRLRDESTGKPTEAAKSAFAAIAADYANESGIPLDTARQTLGAAVMKARESK